MSDLIVSISGLRGIVGDSLTPQVATQYAAAFGHFCNGGTIVLGYDGRQSGIFFAEIIRSTLSLAGCKVIYLGVVPTPTVQLAVEYHKAQGGISITASHNPEEWNGMKFIDSTGVFLDQEQNNDFWKIVSNNSSVFARWNEIGYVKEEKDFSHKHVDTALRMKHVNFDAIRSEQFKIVVDAVNASGSFIVLDLLTKLNCEVIPLYCEGNGRFPHTPEPIPQNLCELGKAVIEHKADLGIAVDPDADRLVFFTEKGEPFGEEYTITTAVDSILSRHPRPQGQHVVINLSTTRAVEDIAGKYGALVTRTPVGEINVVKKMRELNALIGGEGSGGVILPSVHSGRDSLVGIVLALDAFAKHNGTVSDYRSSLPNYVITKKKFSTEDIGIESLLQKIRNGYSPDQINSEDGLRINLDEGWIHLRKSNTEPIIRIIAEARTETEANNLADGIIALMKEKRNYTTGKNNEQGLTI